MRTCLLIKILDFESLSSMFLLSTVFLPISSASFLFHSTVLSFSLLFLFSSSILMPLHPPTPAALHSWEHLRNQLDARRGALAKARTRQHSLGERLASSERELAALEARLGGPGAPKASIRPAPTGLEQQHRWVEER